jgi:uncharacterized membrane protein
LLNNKNLATKRQRPTIQRPKDKEQQYNDQKTKNNNTANKRKRTTIQQPKDKEQQYSDQKTKNNNIKTKVLLLFVFLSLYCCSLSFGRCFVVLFLLVAVLLFFVFWLLYYCSLSFVR